MGGAIDLDVGEVKVVPVPEGDVKVASDGAGGTWRWLSLW